MLQAAGLSATVWGKIGASENGPPFSDCRIVEHDGGRLRYVAVGLGAPARAVLWDLILIMDKAIEAANRP
jgi:hypothetical protein